MAKEETVEMEGTVKEAVKGKFLVEIPSTNPDADPHIVLAHPSGKMRVNNIKIVPGDRVKVEVSPYDMGKGRIVYRMK